MRIKEGFILREMGETFAAVPVEGESKQFYGMIQLNETGAFLWRNMEKECSEKQLVATLMETYDVDEAQAKKDVSAVVEKFRKAGILVE